MAHGRECPLRPALLFLLPSPLPTSGQVPAAYPGYTAAPTEGLLLSCRVTSASGVALHSVSRIYGIAGHSPQPSRGYPGLGICYVLRDAAQALLWPALGQPRASRTGGTLPLSRATWVCRLTLINIQAHIRLPLVALRMNV